MLQTFFITLILMLILNIVGQKLIINSNDIDYKRFSLITLIQTIIISVLLVYVF